MVPINPVKSIFIRQIDLKPIEVIADFHNKRNIEFIILQISFGCRIKIDSRFHSDSGL